MNDKGPNGKPLFEKNKFFPISRKERHLMQFLIVSYAICLILLTASLFTPWYAIKWGDGPEYNLVTRGDISYSFEGKYEFNYYFGATPVHKWTDLHSQGFLKNVYYTELSLIVGLLFLLSIVVIMSVYYIKGKFRVEAFCFSFVVSIMCILAPILFMINHPDALHIDNEGFPIGPRTFFGEIKEYIDQPDVPANELHVVTWGPEIGWYLSLSAGLVSLFTSIFLMIYYVKILKKKDPLHLRKSP